jgi:hypothetical protein
MNTLINIDNYEEIMFRLVEDDFDESTRIDLLRQIESDALFKFEWESWQKAKFVDPLENYAIESNGLTEKIILIAEPKPAGKKRFFYYLAAAASILLLIASLFLLTTDFNSKPRQNVAEKVSKSQTPVKNAIEPVQLSTVSIIVANRNQARNQRLANISIPAVTDSNAILPTKNTFSETPKVIDSIPVKSNELAKAPEKKPRYSITIETSDISGPDPQNYVMAQREKVKIGKVFTNTKMFLRRKPNGEPDRIILIGDDNSYVCLNLNY